MSTHQEMIASLTQPRRDSYPETEGVPCSATTFPSCSASRSALGVVIFSGVSFATFFTLFIVPAVYNLMARGTGSPNAIAKRLSTLTAEAGR